MFFSLFLLFLCKRLLRSRVQMLFERNRRNSKDFDGQLTGNWNFAQRYYSGEWRFQFRFSLLMQFPDFSVYCLFSACKGTIQGKGGLGNHGTSVEIKRLTGKWRTVCAPDSISGNGRNRKTPNSIRQNGRSKQVSEWHSNDLLRCTDDIKTDAAKGNNKRRKVNADWQSAEYEEATPRWRTAHVTKKNTYRQGCRYVIGG